MIAFPPRRVLVVLDPSPESSLAWEHAAFLRRKFCCALEAVHFREREPAERLCGLARRRGAGLIVIAPRPRSLGRLFKTPLAERLIRESPVPVLAVRGRPGPVRGVLAAVSEREYSAASLRLAAEAAAAFGAWLDVLRVCPRTSAPSNPLISLTRLLDGLPPALAAACRPRAEVRFGKPADEILDAAMGRQLIIMAARGKAPLESLLHGKTAVRVLRRSVLPVLFLPRAVLPSPGGGEGASGPFRCGVEGEAWAARRP